VIGLRDVAWFALGAAGTVALYAVSRRLTAVKGIC
jgi:hypothetical protein